MSRRDFPGSIRPPVLDRWDWVDGTERDDAGAGRDSTSVAMGRPQPPVDSADAVNLGAREALLSSSRAEAAAGQQGLAVPGVDVSKSTPHGQHH